MLSDLDLWRAANVMIKRYGDGAAIEAAMRADEFLDQKPYPKRGRGRETGFPVPPAQVPACGTTAPGSSLGFWRRSGDLVGDAIS